jgi:hypothetical protein
MTGFVQLLLRVRACSIGLCTCTRLARSGYVCPHLVSDRSRWSEEEKSNSNYEELRPQRTGSTLLLRNVNERYRVQVGFLFLSALLLIQPLAGLSLQMTHAAHSGPESDILAPLALPLPGPWCRCCITRMWCANIPPPLTLCQKSLLVTHLEAYQWRVFYASLFLRLW